MRVRRLDAAVGIALAIAGAWTATLQSDGPWPIVGGALLGAAFGVIRSRPMLGFAFTVAGTTLAGIGGLIADGPMLLLLAASFAIGLYAGRVAGVVAVVALFVADLTHALSADDWVPSVMFPAVFWGAGRAMRAHEVVAARLRERAAELAQEREAYAQLSVRYERARIAAELHDIVAHAISVMVVQASAGQRLAAVDHELTTQTFHTIADAARQAEDDMGRLVALLSDAPDAGPAPDIALVQELVTRAAGSGLDVTLRLEGPLDDLSGPMASAAYRVVQESLTNALRYAAGAQVAVRVRGGEDALDVEVTNGPARSEGLRDAGTGNGLAGLRERVDACGGSLQAGPLHDGGWRVAARIPRRSAVRV